MVVAVTVNRMSDFIGYFRGSFVQTVTKRMIVALVVVISHITLEFLRGVNSGTSSFLYSNLLLGWVPTVDDVSLSRLGGMGVVL